MFLFVSLKRWQFIDFIATHATTDFFPQIVGACEKKTKVLGRQVEESSGWWQLKDLFIFIPKIWKIIQFDGSHIFQMGWFNHMKPPTIVMMCPDMIHLFNKNPVILMGGAQVRSPGDEIFLASPARRGPPSYKVAITPANPI